MKLVVTSFFMAWGMFWIVPCPVKWWDERGRVGMLLFLPAVGLLIGLVWALSVWLRERFLPGPLGAAVVAVIPYILSGFIHLDGYMDCSDAVLSRRDLETRRKILKDSHVGSFAVVALVVLFLLEYAAFSGGPLGDKLWLLPFVCAVSRSCSVCAVSFFRPIPGSSYEKMFSNGVSSGARLCALLTTILLVLVPILVFGKIGFCTFVGAVASFLTIIYIRHDLQGMSGDVSGAGITVGEFCALAALTIL